jgi:hypothetical protein
MHYGKVTEVPQVEQVRPDYRQIHLWYPYMRYPRLESVYMMCIIQINLSKKSFFYSKKTPYIYFMNKRQLLNQVKTLLAGYDILEGTDYIFSLQGPTVILTLQGTPKITPEIKTILKGLNVILL